jgi:hypothetical protein
MGPRVPGRRPALIAWYDAAGVRMIILVLIFLVLGLVLCFLAARISPPEQRPGFLAYGITAFIFAEILRIVIPLAGFHL